MKQKIFYIIIAFTIFVVYFLVFGKILSKKVEPNYGTKIVENLVIVEKLGSIIKYGENLIKKNKNSKNIISNGFFIKENIILTTSHSVGYYEDEYNIIFKGGEKIRAELIKKDEKKDIAILKTKNNFKNHKKIFFGKDIKVGEKVYTYFYNLETKKVEKKSGKIIRISPENIFSDIKLEKGNSGSPLLNKKGEVIGINTGFDIKDNLGVSSRY